MLDTTYYTSSPSFQTLLPFSRADLVIGVVYPGYRRTQKLNSGNRRLWENERTVNWVTEVTAITSLPAPTL